MCMLLTSSGRSHDIGVLVTSSGQSFQFSYEDVCYSIVRHIVVRDHHVMSGVDSTPQRHPNYGILLSGDFYKLNDDLKRHMPS